MRPSATALCTRRKLGQVKKNKPVDRPDFFQKVGEGGPYYLLFSIFFVIVSNMVAMSKMATIRFLKWFYGAVEVINL